MTTLGTLKSEIADDLDRTDLTSAIAAEITKAISYYQSTRFYFNESRNCVIATIANQKEYSDQEDSGPVYYVVVDDNGAIVVDDNGAIVIAENPDDVTDTLESLIEVDQVLLEGAFPASDAAVELCQITPKEWELLTDNSETTGRPISWSMFARAYGLYPIPDNVYTIRFTGHVRKAAPANDNETGNVWMTEAFDLIRSRVVARLALRKLRDVDLGQIHTQLEGEELRRLRAETASRFATGFITPTEF